MKCISVQAMGKVTCNIVHAKIKAPLGSTYPMYCTCSRKPFAKAAVSAETH